MSSLFLEVVKFRMVVSRGFRDVGIRFFECFQKESGDKVWLSLYAVRVQFFLVKGRCVGKGGSFQGFLVVGGVVFFLDNFVGFCLFVSFFLVGWVVFLQMGFRSRYFLLLKLFWCIGEKGWIILFILLFYVLYFLLVYLVRCQICFC